MKTRTIAVLALSLAAAACGGAPVEFSAMPDAAPDAAPDAVWNPGSNSEDSGAVPEAEQPDAPTVSQDGGSEASIGIVPGPDASDAPDALEGQPDGSSTVEPDAGSLAPEAGPQPCDSATCPAGCCDPAGVCHLLSQTYCGTQGYSCDNCAAAGAICTNGGSGNYWSCAM